MTGQRTCRHCGCTEHNACVDDERGACSWASANQCAHCVDSLDLFTQLVTNTGPRVQISAPDAEVGEILVPIHHAEQLLKMLQHRPAEPETVDALDTGPRISDGLAYGRIWELLRTGGDGITRQEQGRLLAELLLVRSGTRIRSPDEIAAGEAIYAAYCASVQREAPHDGTRADLDVVAGMLERWGPDALPANEHGQVHFVRAMMDSAAGTIRAFLSRHPEQG